MDIIEALSILPFWFGYAGRNRTHSADQRSALRRCGSALAVRRLFAGETARMEKGTHVSILLHGGEEVEPTVLLRTRMRKNWKLCRTNTCKSQCAFEEFCYYLSNDDGDDSDPMCMERTDICIMDDAGNAAGRSQHNQHDMLEKLRHDLSLLFTEDWIGLNTDFAAVPNIHPFARIASQMVHESDRAINIFHVFTDGACKRFQAAWAFVVLCEVSAHERRTSFRVGYATGLVESDITDEEAMAIIARDVPNMQIFFHYDASFCRTWSLWIAKDPQRSRWIFRQATFCEDHVVHPTTKGAKGKGYPRQIS